MSSYKVDEIFEELEQRSHEFVTYGKIFVLQIVREDFEEIRKKYCHTNNRKEVT